MDIFGLPYIFVFTLYLGFRKLLKVGMQLKVSKLFISHKP